MSQHAPFFRWFPKDYNSDALVQAMTDDQDLAFRRMIDASWELGPLPNDPERLAAIVRYDSKRFARTWLWPLTECWPAIKKGKFVINHRLEDERDSFLERSAKGRKAAEEMWKKRHKRMGIKKKRRDGLASAEQSPSNAQAMPEPCSDDATQSHITKPKPEPEPKSPVPPDDDPFLEAKENGDILEDWICRSTWANREDLAERRVEAEGCLRLYNDLKGSSVALTSKLFRQYVALWDLWEDPMKILEAVKGLFCDPDQWATKRNLGPEFAWKDAEIAERYVAHARDGWESGGWEKLLSMKKEKARRER